MKAHTVNDDLEGSDGVGEIKGHHMIGEGIRHDAAAPEERLLQERFVNIIALP